MLAILKLQISAKKWLGIWNTMKEILNAKLTLWDYASTFYRKNCSLSTEYQESTTPPTSPTFASCVLLWKMKTQLYNAHYCTLFHLYFTFIPIFTWSSRKKTITIELFISQNMWYASSNNNKTTELAELFLSAALICNTMLSPQTIIVTPIWRNRSLACCVGGSGWSCRLG